MVYEIINKVNKIMTVVDYTSLSSFINTDTMNNND